MKTTGIKGFHSTILALTLTCLLPACTRPKAVPAEPTGNNKLVIYQVFTRLFGNKETTNKPWGTIGENGVGKFDDFTDKALSEIKALGVTHIWYTGVPQHASVTDYSAFGMPGDDPDVVKGRAGSPYAIKDYYSADPDLADDPSKRMQEFRELVERTHRNGLKVIIDIVPNHVARGYNSTAKPDGAEDFGSADDTSAEYRKDNNFYYIPGSSFEVPDPENGYKPLGGENHPLSDGKYSETPAKWTGNGSRNPKPSFYDWYETVKVNFGVRPDGTKDFDSIPGTLAKEPVAAHNAFWQNREVPGTWKKFRDIALFWLDQGVDGFRYDMAEMVPVEFWSYMNSAIKNKNKDALLLAEIYNPAIYRDYISKGKMDLLYDKVDLYDTVKHIMQGNGSADHLPAVLDRLSDIDSHLLRFLENHDEQRIASPEFSGDAEKGKPAMVLTATAGTSAVLVYFGQEVGEPGDENGGFGQHSRTSIFDYVGVPHHQQWMNNGLFDGGQLLQEEKELRDFYKRLLNFTLHSPALSGHYCEIHTVNKLQTSDYTDRIFSYVRWNEKEKLVIICNFDAENGYNFDIHIPSEIISKWELKNQSFAFSDQLYGGEYKMMVSGGEGAIPVRLKPLESLILRLE